jgi:DNA-binding HxlR family transcriptional regulator
MWHAQVMKPYGQFCSIAKALEVMGERWSPLILRELICGSSRYNEIHRGMPRISPALLSKRLADLERSGVIARDPDTGSYALTEAGWELKPLIEQLGVWGQRWVRGQLTDEDFDPDVVMWDMRRRIDLAQFPEARTCLKFEISTGSEEMSHYWIVGDRAGLELCVTDPGHPVDLYITTDARTLALVWNGDLPLRAIIEEGEIELHGPTALMKAFPGWLQLGLFAGVAAATH